VLNVCVELVQRDTNLTETDRVLTKKRYIDRARELHQEAIRRCEGDADMQNLLAWQLAMLRQDWIHNPSKGVELAEEAVRRKPTEAAFWTTLGLARFRANDPCGAVDALNEAVRLGNGGASRDWLYLALAHAKMGDRQVAQKWYDRAVMDAQSDLPNDWELKNLRAEAASVLAASVESRN
jgi:uncharacterized protein HemY